MIEVSPRALVVLALVFVALTVCVLAVPPWSTGQLFGLIAHGLLFVAAVVVGVVKTRR